MKFKPIYLYGALLILVILFLIIVSNQSGSDEVVKETVSNEGKIPEDDIHKPLRSGEQPNKDNVSEGFKHRVDVLKKAIEENPNDTTSLRKYADLLAAAHMSEEAIRYYNKILQIDPNRTDILFSLSFIHHSQGDMKSAEDYTNRILVIEPDNANALYNLGAISATNGETEKAKEIWRKLVEQYPDKEIGIRAKNSVEKL